GPPRDTPASPAVRPRLPDANASLGGVAALGRRRSCPSSRGPVLAEGDAVAPAGVAGPRHGRTPPGEGPPPRPPPGPLRPPGGPRAGSAATGRGPRPEGLPRFSSAVGSGTPAGSNPGPWSSTWASVRPAPTR